MKAGRVRIAASACLGVLAAGCASAIPPGEDPEPRGHGRIEVGVRWPERRALAIPLETEKIDVAAYVTLTPEQINAGLDDKKPYRTALLRSPFSLFSTASLEAIPPGIVRISAVAKDKADRVLATGTKVLDILPNQFIQAAIRLEVPAVTPVIEEVLPANSFPGRWVSLLGSGFGFSSGATFSVRLGGIEVPEALLSRPSDQIISFEVPLGATTSVPELSVGDLEAAAPSTFTTIASVSLEPPLLVLKRGEVFLMKFTVLDSAGTPVDKPTLVWSRPYMACTGCPDGDVAWIDPDGTLEAEPDIYSGVMTLQLGIPPVAASATIYVVPD